MSLDQVLTELSPNVDPENADLLLVVHDPAGTPETQKITVENFRESDPNRPSTDEKAALAGTGDPPSSTNKYVTESDPILSSAAEKAALAGTNGTPSGTNRYVTDSDSRNSDSRTPTAHAATHAVAGSDPVSLSWTQVDKTGSSLADLTTRNASDLTGGTLAPALGGTGSAALANGSVPFIISGGVFSEDNTKLVWNDATKRLGVGTASPTARLTVNTNTAGVAGAGADTVAHVIQEDGVLASLLVDSFGNLPSLSMRRANSGVAAKSAILSGDSIGRVRVFGYGTTAYSSVARGIFECVATENWSDSAQGTLWRWFATETGGTSTVERLRLHASGGLSLNNTADPGAGAFLATASIKSNGATGGIGYANGAGGTQTQTTSKSTGVTLNAACGHVTMNNAALAAATIVTFTLNNSAISSGDVLVLNHVSGGTAGAYGLNAQCGAGAASINVRNHTAGSLSEAIVIAFAVIKGVTA